MEFFQQLYARKWERNYLHDNGKWDPHCNSPAYPNKTDEDRSLRHSGDEKCHGSQETEEYQSARPYVTEQERHDRQL